MLKRKKTTVNSRFAIKGKENKQLIQQHKFEVYKDQNAFMKTYKEKK